jgi:FkbM family methyltransferase
MNLLRIKDFPRYVRELPDFLRGCATTKTKWGEDITVSFPEYRSIVEKGYITGHGEEAVYEYLNSHLSNKDIFFDIGANIGFYSLLGAHLGAKTYAFEPFPSTRSILIKNVNGKNVEVYPYAVSDKKGKLKMVTGRYPGLNKISENGKTEVESISLDEFGVIPTIMKVDVEDHEMDVFMGAKKLIEEHAPIIVAEVSPESSEYLVSLGYTATLLGKTNYVFTRPK